MLALMISERRGRGHSGEGSAVGCDDWVQLCCHSYLARWCPMVTAPRSEQPAERGHVTRAIEVTLDPSPTQERWLRSYAGSMRSVYNWSIVEASKRNELRKAERAAGVAEGDLSPALWSSAALSRHWRANRAESHPWHAEVSIHAFETGLNNAAQALKNFFESRDGDRRGRRVGFPRFKNRHSRQSVTFSEGHVDHTYWVNEQTRRHVRLMLPQRAPDGTWERRHTRPKAQQPQGRDRKHEVQWIRSHQPLDEVWKLCESGDAQVQALTLKFEGGRWKAVFRLRVFVTDTNPAGRLRNPGEPAAWHGGAVGVDLGLEHLATLDRPIDGLTDEDGHVPNPRPLQRHLERLARMDRAIARCQKGSNNRAKLVRRRQKLHGSVTATRKLYLHELTRRLAAGFDVVCIEDLQRVWGSESQAAPPRACLGLPPVRRASRQGRQRCAQHSRRGPSPSARTAPRRGAHRHLDTRGDTKRRSEDRRDRTCATPWWARTA